MAMIRTLIEVHGDTQWEFEDRLNAALGNLGYERKPSEDTTQFRADLFAALRAKGLDPLEMVEQYRAANISISHG